MCILTTLVAFRRPTMPYSLWRGIIRSENVQSRFCLQSTQSFIDLNLAQEFAIDKFLQFYEKDNLAINGVFALEGVAPDSFILVDQSSDVYKIVKDITTAAENHLDNSIKSIRIQSFPETMTDSKQAYKDELVRQAEPQFASTDDFFSFINDKVAKGISSPAAADNSLTSPFAGVPESASNIDIQPFQELEFTFANVDKVLDEVRPYLQADGGNVAVVEVDKVTRGVKLLLEGACGSCPSSTTTMKMGIERILKENFSNLGDIVSVEPNEAASLNIEKIYQSLEKLMPAITNLGGSVEIVGTDSAAGSVSVRFKGPARLQKGLELVLKDNKSIKEVIFV